MSHLWYALGRLGGWLLLGGVGCALLLFGASPAEAYKRNFAWSYEWFTPYQGEKEIELWLTDSSEEGSWETRVEYEFAASPRWAIGLYATRDEDADETLDFNGWKWENRYRFGDFALQRWLHAGYLELKKERGESHEVEAKWLLSRYTEDEALALNLTAERHLESGADVEWEASAGWNRSVGLGWRAGVEAFGSFTDDAWYLGPNATYDPSSNSRIILGAGFGLTGDSDDRRLRLLTEYEW